MSKRPRQKIRTDATRAGGESQEQGDAVQARRRKLGNTATARITEKEEEIYSFDSGWAKGFDPSELNDDGRKMFGFPEEETRMSPKEKREREKALQIAGQKSQEPQRLTHKMLRVMAGKEGGRKLWSPADEKVRPMMEVVRGAVFSMLQALAGSPSMMPPGRWLDLYSGTGSVGIEALSRGCQSSHFVELDPWVINNVLSRNLDVTNFTDKAVIHMQRVEAFLERTEKSGGASSLDRMWVDQVEVVLSGTFHYAVCGENWTGPQAIVEYPRKSKSEILDRCGPLHKIRDRRYGRTNVAVYGPEWAIE
ncbi:hypothetical protein CBR_g31858 [Chara braunii]|uniref:Methyltransferase n=1 Tax=Chara braunii TaxID=69332 RepID=A0A388LG28_CHABU|nr:hypothetical protein CBR_g31858 [Chara braunii]|eukprot:GBG81183.1 hypothetical protein CBR_g31858 [Chara braunii]